MCIVICCFTLKQRKTTFELDLNVLNKRFGVQLDLDHPESYFLLLIGRNKNANSNLKLAFFFGVIID